MTSKKQQNLKRKKMSSLTLWLMIVNAAIAFGGLAGVFLNYMIDQRNNRESEEKEANAEREQKRLKEQLEDLKRDTQEVRGKLSPFIDAAMKFAPGLSQEEALNKLREQIKIITEKMADRTLTDNQKQKMIAVLNSLSGSSVIIAFAPREPERYAGAIVSVFESAGWKVDRVAETITGSGIQPLTLTYAKSAESSAVTIVRAFEAAGIKLNIRIGPGGPLKGDLYISVQPKD